MMIWNTLGVAAAVAFACAGCNEASNTSGNLNPAPPPVLAEPTVSALELPNTAVHEVPAAVSGRHYQLWVSMPTGYERAAGKKYPVVFVTDAAYSFPLVRSIRSLLGQRGRNIEEFILVGLPPERQMTSKDSRSRDYTPSIPVRRSPSGTGEYSAATYGEAEAYRDYLEQQVFPLISAEYDADMSRKVFVGHSYGGLFGSYVLLTKPHMFSTYILGSPSLWFDNHEILKIEEAYSQKNTDLPARVMLYAGEFEKPGRGPRYFTSVDLVGDMQNFARRLESRGYKDLSVESSVLGDEDHLTVFPALVSRGLLWALPGHGPYTSG